MEFHLVSINCRYSHSCLAQFYLRNALQVHLPQCAVTISQLTINDPYYTTLLRITAIPAQAVLFSVYIWNHRIIRRLAGDLSRLLPELPLIFGGPQASALVGLSIQCTVVRGEIEGAGEQFYRDLAAGTLQPLYEAGAGRDFPSPYREEDFSGPLHNRQLYYESSRGCPFFCAYCLSSVSRGVRHKPLDLVYAELQQLLAVRPLIIKFVDRTFNDDYGRAAAIWSFLLQQAGSVKCHFEIAPDRFSPEMLALLEDVPCDLFQFEIGIQSCNPETLAAVNRQVDLDRAGEYIRRLVALDTIHLHLDLILGLPHETRESFRASFNRVFAFGAQYIQLGLLKVLPGTEMAERAREYGLVFCSEPPYEVLETRWLEHGELRELYEFCQCVESFYNTRFFQSLWQYLRNCAEEPFAFFQSLLTLCRSHGFFERARTHSLMNHILCTLLQQRSDAGLLLELLAFDWLRCGHRTLPEYFAGTPQKDLRDQLRLQLPQSLPGLYDYHSRVEFLKQSSFLELSVPALEELGLPHSGPATAAFLPEQSGGVMKFNRVAVIPSL
ncbi:MAG: DUF4080 domain-containing protein [Desulfocapsa sp.]|nr:MAG: DUF4080 domain-containing protein [Desulfocapsa sp.]